MVINKTIIKELEDAYRISFNSSLKKYLLVKYGEEPFPHEFSEQDLYTQIEHDIRAYEAGELDVKVKSQSDRWKEEREYLRSLYIDKCYEIRELSDYVTDLEHILWKNGLESNKMAKWRIELEKNDVF